MESTRVQACLRAYTHAVESPTPNVETMPRIAPTEERAECLTTIPRSVQLCLRESTFRVAVRRRGSDSRAGRSAPALLHCDH